MQMWVSDADVALGIASTFLPATQSERGCLEYDLYRPLNDTTGAWYKAKKNHRELFAK